MIGSQARDIPTLDSAGFYTIIFILHTFVKNLNIKISLSLTKKQPKMRTQSVIERQNSLSQKALLCFQENKMQYNLRPKDKFFKKYLRAEVAQMVEQLIRNQ